MSVTCPSCRVCLTRSMPRSLHSQRTARMMARLSTMLWPTAVPHPVFWTQECCYAANLHRIPIPCYARVVGTAQAVLLDQPLRVVARDERTDGVTHVVDGLVDATVHDLLLEGAEEALDHPVRFRFTDEGVARGDAPEADLPVEVLGQKSAAVIVTQCEAAGGAG